MSKKLHNPKSHAPAVYIPCWLIQVHHNNLSYAAKILYGRLSQWSNATGKVYRTVQQLSNEIGAEKRQVDRYIKELKYVGLIGTFHPKKGGVSHFEFYDHEWMHEPINEQLSYSENPTTNLSLPHDKNVVTPTTNLSSINIKEIKEIKKYTPLTGNKPFLLTIQDLLTDNPHNIEDQMLNEWLMIRKKKKAPLTPTAWKRTNNVMTKLSEKGLSPGDCFERMVANGWQGMEYKYFEQELKNPVLVKSSSTLKKETDEERIKRWERERQENLRKRG